MSPTKSVAVITGGSRGLGLAIAHALREAGMQVETCAHTADVAQSIAQVDVRRSDQVDAFISDILRKHGRIDILINNAGWSESLMPLEEVTEEAMNQCIDTNVKGVFHFLHAVLPIMKQQKGGKIINICSRAGSRAHPLLPIYSASKFAVRGFTQAVARSSNENGAYIHCVSISPAGIDTPMRAALFGADNSHKQQKPEEVASLIVQHLTSSDEWPNGADIQIANGKVDRITLLDA